MHGTLPFEPSVTEIKIYPTINEARKSAVQRTIQYQQRNNACYDAHFHESKFKVGELVIYGTHYTNNLLGSPFIFFSSFKHLSVVPAQFSEEVLPLTTTTMNLINM